MISAKAVRVHAGPVRLFSPQHRSFVHGRRLPRLPAPELARRCAETENTGVYLILNYVETFEKKN